MKEHFSQEYNPLWLAAVSVEEEHFLTPSHYQEVSAKQSHYHIR